MKQHVQHSLQQSLQRSIQQPLRQIRNVALVAGLAAALTLGQAVAPVYAQATNGTLSDFGEGENRILSSDWTVLNPGEQITYQFAYDGDEQPVSVWMNVVPADAASFDIWTDERLAEREEDAETPPLGEGTAMNEGTGFTNWQGGSPEAETYYVVVTADGPSAARFLLNVSSPALSADQPGATAVGPVAPADPNIAVVTTDALNVRSGPSTAFPVLVTVPNGTEMTVLGRNATNTWINVQLADGTEGWVTRSLTSYTLVSPNIIASGAVAATVGAGVTVTGTTTATTTTNVTTTVATTDTATITPTVAITPTELGAGWQVLSAGDVDWYTFQYRGGNLPLTIWMDMEPFEDAEFTVLSAEVAQQMMAGTLTTPTTGIGTGRANPVEPGYLFWQAEFAEADTFYVMVEPAATAEGDVLYSINALGPGVGRVIEPVE